MHIIFSLFLQTIKLSLMATVAAIIIWFIKLLFKNKMGPTWHYYIWFIVIIRLILPYSLNSPVSVYNTVNINRSVSKNIINSSNTQMVSNPTTIYTKVKSNTNFIQSNEQNILHILSMIWISVIAIGAIYLIFVYLMFCFKIKSESDFREVAICDTLEQCKKEMKIKHNIRIKKSKNVKTPCITGLIKPVILIPDYMVRKLTNEEMKYVIIHELAHFKRKDTLVNWIVIVLNLVHWFNPILYFSFKKFKQDSEMSCDAKALSCIESKKRKEYGNTIISLTSIVSAFDVKPWEVAMVSKSEIKRRIIMISKFKKRTLVGTTVGVLAAVVIGACVLTNAKSLGIDGNKTAEASTSVKASNKVAATKNDENKKDNTADTKDNSSSANQNNASDNTSTTGTKSTHKQKQSEVTQSNAKTTSKSTATAANTASKTTTNTATKEDCTPEQAAIAAMNYETGSSKVTSVTKGPSGSDYANFSSGDMGATVFNSQTKDGKKCYRVHLSSQSMKQNGGSGTIDNLYVSSDGSVSRN